MFGDFSSRPFPNIVADLQIKDVLLEAMRRINDVLRKQSQRSLALIGIGFLSFLVMFIVLSVHAVSSTDSSSTSTDTHYTNSSTPSTPTGHKNVTVSETDTYNGPLWLLLLLFIIVTMPWIALLGLIIKTRRDCEKIVEESNRKRKYILTKT